MTKTIQLTEVIIFLKFQYFTFTYYNRYVITKIVFKYNIYYKRLSKDKGPTYPKNDILF